MTSAQFVIAGRVDCERYARLEAAADHLQARLPSCRVFKEPQTADHWPCYLRRTCLQHGWHLPVDTEAPLVWRPLVQRGGRGLLIGGLSQFRQMASVYYGIPLPELDERRARPMAAETALAQQQERTRRRHERAALERRLTCVAFIGTVSKAAEHFLVALATGRVLGEELLLRLQIYGDPRLPEMTALRNNLLDLASEQLGQVALLPNLREAVRNATVVIILDPIQNRVPPATPEPTPPPTPSQPPTPTGELRSTDISDDEIAAAMRAATPGADGSATSPPPPAISLTPTEQSPPPAPREMPDSMPPMSSRFPSAESRRLSTIQEDPDSEALEEEEMMALAASRPNSGRQGMLSGLSRSQEPTPDGTTDAQERPHFTLISGEKFQSEGDAQPPEAVTTAAAAATAPASGEGAATTTAGETTAAVAGQDAGASDAAPSPEVGNDAPPGPSASLPEQPCDVSDEEVVELFDRMRQYASAIDETASSHCRVVVAGGRLPCFGATVILLHMERLPPSNVLALCQPRVNQLRALLARQLSVSAHDIHGLVEWGCPPAGRRWLDLEGASVSRHTGAILGPPGYKRAMLEVLHQQNWLQKDMPYELARRAGTDRLEEGAEVSALTLAVCLARTLRQWWAGHEDGAEHSLGIATDGSVPGVPERLVFAGPARMCAGDYRASRALPDTPEGAASVRAAAAQMVDWLQLCGVRLSPSGRRCTISTCASSVYGSEPPVSTESEPEPPQVSADGDGDGVAEDVERRPSTARGERTPSATDTTSRTASAEKTEPPAPPQEGQGEAPEVGTEEKPAAGERAEEKPAAGEETEEKPAAGEETEEKPAAGEGAESPASRPASNTQDRPITAESERGAIRTEE